MNEYDFGWIIVVVIVIALIITFDSVWTKNYCRDGIRLDILDWVFGKSRQWKVDKGT